ncbi:hypothetical protein Aperf_G00000061025 [Anoplocephala perfoliata]
MCVGFSRLCPSFENVVNDPLLLTYFLQYLSSIKVENIFRFWLELSGCKDRRRANEEPFEFKSEERVLSNTELDELRDKISHLSVNYVTTIYVRYISSKAKLAVNLPSEILSTTLLRILENPCDILALEPCLQFSESKLRSILFPDFLKSDFFSQFCAEIVLNNQLNLNDILFEESTLACFVEFLAGDPTSCLLNFLMAVNAYKVEFHELMLKSDHAETIQERHEQLLNDATTICAKYLSPASDDFMGLTLEQYRDALDAACSENEPRDDCFDSLYNLIFKTVEKNILPAFFQSASFARYRENFAKKSGLKTRYVSTNISTKNQSKRQLAPIQLNVLALSDASLANRLPRVYMDEAVPFDEKIKFSEGGKRNKFLFLFKKSFSLRKLR